MTKKAQTLPALRAARVRLFLADLREIGHFGYVQVRTVKLADEFRLRGVAQLRTKNDLDAIAWDELGNAFALTAGGTRLNLTAKEVDARRAA